MSWFHSTEDYDISSSYLGDKITKKDTDDSGNKTTPPKPPDDEGRPENERGHTNFNYPPNYIDQQKQR
jgi:hypothetical protein